MIDLIKNWSPLFKLATFEIRKRVGWWQGLLVARAALLASSTPLRELGSWQRTRDISALVYSLQRETGDRKRWQHTDEGSPLAR